MVVAMSFSLWRLGMFSNSKPGMLLARRRILSVGILRLLVSSASGGQWLSSDMIPWTRAWAAKPLSEFLFMAFVRFSILIWVALSVMGGSPRPASLSGR